MSSKILLPAALLCVMMIADVARSAQGDQSKTPEYGAEMIALPMPKHTGAVSLEEAISKRRSVRVYKEGPVSLSELSQLLWAAQGATGQGGMRSAPSAGALYPLELSVVAGNVSGLASGIYKYRPGTHELAVIAKGDVRNDLCKSSLGQPSIRNAAVILILSAVYERTTVKYGERGVRYVHMEAGHAAQNACLQAVTLQLGTVVIGAFHDESVKRLLKMTEREDPLYLIPVGRR